jgi:hypothetical protein
MLSVTAGHPDAALSHFLRKLVFAAPESGLPFLSIALGSRVSLAHFETKLVKAVPAKGLSSLPIALLRHESFGADHCGSRESTILYAAISA